MKFVVEYRNLQGDWIHAGWEFKNQVSAMKCIIVESTIRHNRLCYRIEKIWKSGVNRIVWEGR